MAAIDKYYSYDVKEAKALITKISTYTKVYCGTYLGDDYFFNPNDDTYLKLEDFETRDIDWSKGFPLWNSPYVMDYWLFKNFQEFPNVIDDLKWKYDGLGEEKTYNSYVKGKFGVDFDKYKQGHHYTILKKPCPFIMRVKQNWRMEAVMPNGEWLLFDEQKKSWVPSSLRNDNTSPDFFLGGKKITKRYLLRLLRKMKFPVGAIVTIDSYIYYGKIVIQIRK